MKKLLPICLVIFFIKGQAQEHQIMQPEAVVKTFFKGFHESDESTIRSTLHEDFTLQSVVINKEQKTSLIASNAEQFISTVVARAKLEGWTEKISSYKVNTDGLLATVWTPYEFYLGENYIHCGVNVFTLIKINATWKIIAIIDTRKQTCA